MKTIIIPREKQDEMINISILLVLNSYIDNNYDFIYLYKNYKSIFSLLDSSLIFQKGGKERERERERE